MCNIYDRYTGKIMLVSMEKWNSLNTRDTVRGIKKLVPRYEFLGEVNPSFVN